MADFNLMQAQLGLLGGEGNSNPVGIPTPRVKSPGEVSQEASQQSFQAATQTMQATGVLPSTPVRGMYTGASAAMNPLGTFAQQYQANMQQIQAQQLNPFLAQGLAQGLGMPGFLPGMLPSPTQMTSPSMGLFRPFPAPPQATIPPVPQLPFIPTPFTPSLPSPHFQTPWDYQTAIGTQRIQQYQGAALAAPGLLGRIGADVGTGFFGAATGAYMGARIAGPTGAILGGLAGMAGGVAGAEWSGFGRSVQRTLNEMNPFSADAARAQQVRALSQGFVVSGSDLDPTGRGLSTAGANHLGRLITSTANNKQFQAETGGMSANDLTRILGSASELGMMDMSQNSKQITDKVRTLAKSVKNFMQLTGEPDFQEALKALAKLQTMGVGPQYQAHFLQDAKMFAKMAGTTVKDLMDSAGLQGAMMYQNAGLSAGLGVQMGMGAYGLAKQAVAGGAFDNRQLALLGGVSGIAQREMESNLALLKMPMMAAGMGTIGAGGTFGVNGRSLSALMGGKTDINALAGAGANNLMDAVSKHGVGALGMFQAQQKELQDAMGQAMGPVGMGMMRTNQILSTMKMLGVSGPGGFVTAAQAMGLDGDTAMQLMRQASSPGFFKNIQRQLDVQRNEGRAQAWQEREDQHHDWADREGFRGNLARGWRVFKEQLGTGIDETIEGFGDFFGMSQGARDARAAGGFYIANPRELELSAKGERMASKMTWADHARGIAGLGPIRDKGYEGFGDWLTGINRKDLQNVRDAEGGWGSVFGNGILENLYRGTTGLIGWDGGLMDADELEQRRRKLERGSNILQRGKGMSNQDIDEGYARVAQERGMDVAQLKTQANLFAQALGAEAKQREGWFTDAGQYDDEEMQKIFSRMQDEGKISKNVRFDDVKHLVVKEATARSGSYTKSFQARDMTSATSITATLNTLKASKEKRADRILGTRALHDEFGQELFGGTGVSSERSRSEALDFLFEGTDNNKIRAYLALSAAADTGDAAAQAKLAQLAGTMDEEEKQQANFMSKKNAKHRDQLIASGKTVSGLSVDELIKTFAEEGERHIAEKRHKPYLEGLKKLVKDSDVLDGTEGDAIQVLKKLSLLDPDALTDDQKELVQEFKEAGKDTGRQGEVATKLYRKAVALGNETGFWGGLFGNNEEGINKTKAAVADTQARAAEEFPDAVATFDEASKTLLEAARYLGRVAPTTHYDPGVN